MIFHWLARNLIAVSLMLLFQDIVPSACQMQALDKANRFARSYNEYIHTVQATPEAHKRDKDQLKEKFEEAYQCECF